MKERAGPSILMAWEAIIDEVFERAKNFPKAVRGSLTTQLENEVLEIHRGLLEARFEKQPLEALRRVNLRLDQMRMLLRLAYKRGGLSEGGLRVLTEAIDEVGQRLGGWRREEG